MEKFKQYVTLVQRIHDITDTQVGCNLLIDEEMFAQEGLVMIKLVSVLFDDVKIDRVFALSPKNIPCPDILKYQKVYKF